MRRSDNGLQKNLKIDLGALDAKINVIDDEGGALERPGIDYQNRGLALSPSSDGKSADPAAAAALWRRDQG